MILITGIYQTIDADWEFGSFWISATFLIVIVLGGLLGAYFIPTDRRLGALDHGSDAGGIEMMWAATRHILLYAAAARMCSSRRLCRPLERISRQLAQAP